MFCQTRQPGMGHKRAGAAGICVLSCDFPLHVTHARPYRGVRFPFFAGLIVCPHSPALAHARPRGHPCWAATYETPVSRALREALRRDSSWRAPSMTRHMGEEGRKRAPYSALPRAARGGLWAFAVAGRSKLHANNADPEHQGLTEHWWDASVPRHHSQRTYISTSPSTGTRLRSSPQAVRQWAIGSISNKFRYCTAVEAR